MLILKIEKAILPIIIGKLYGVKKLIGIYSNIGDLHVNYLGVKIVTNGIYVLGLWITCVSYFEFFCGAGEGPIVLIPGC